MIFSNTQICVPSGHAIYKFTIYKLQGLKGCLGAYGEHVGGPIPFPGVWLMSTLHTNYPAENFPSYSHLLAVSDRSKIERAWKLNYSFMLRVQKYWQELVRKACPTTAYTVSETRWRTSVTAHLSLVKDTWFRVFFKCWECKHLNIPKDMLVFYRCTSHTQAAQGIKLCASI